MTRRLLAAVSLTAFMTGGLVLAAAPASAAEDSALCIGGESQRRPGQYNGICIDPRAGSGLLPPL